MSKWIWKVRCFYKNGSLAIETVHQSDHSKDMEIFAAKSRNDIGRIEVIPINRQEN